MDAGVGLRVGLGFANGAPRGLSSKAHKLVELMTSAKVRKDLTNNFFELPMGIIDFPRNECQTLTFFIPIVDVTKIPPLRNRPIRLWELTLIGGLKIIIKTIRKTRETGEYLKVASGGYG